MTADINGIIPINCEHHPVLSVEKVISEDKTK